MATVPNRYYNSPWIAQAAANLTDALFGNPERDYQRLQAQKLQADMDRQAVLDKQTLQDRERKLTSQRLLGEIVAPGIDDAAVQAKLQEYLAAGGDTTAGFAAASTSSPTFKSKAALQDDKQRAALELMGQRLTSQEGMFNDRLKYMYDSLAQALGLANMRDTTTRRGQDISSSDRRYATDAQADIANMRDATTRRGQDITSTDRRYGIDVGAASRQRVQELRNKAAAGRGIKRRDAFLISADIDDRAAQLGIKLDPYQKAQVQRFAEEEGVPVGEAMAIVLEGTSFVPGEEHFFGADDPGTLVSPTPMGLADVLRPQPMPAQAPAAARPPLSSFRR